MIHTPGITADGGARYNYVEKILSRISVEKLKFWMLTTLAYLAIVTIIVVIVWNYPQV